MIRLKQLSRFALGDNSFSEKIIEDKCYHMSKEPSTGHQTFETYASQYLVIKVVSLRFDKI